MMGEDWTTFDGAKKTRVVKFGAVFAIFKFRYSEAKNREKLYVPVFFATKIIGQPVRRNYSGNPLGGRDGNL